MTGTGDFAGNGIIDTHVHVVSDDTARYPRQINASATHPWWVGEDCDTASLRRNMDAHGIAMALAVQAVGVYGYDNAYLLDEVANGSGRVAGVVAVDVDAEDAAEKIRQLSSAAGVVGVRLFAVSPGSSWVHSGKADEAFDAASRSGLPVVLTVFEHQLPPLAPSLARYPTLPIALDHGAFPKLDGARVHRGSPLLELTAAVACDGEGVEPHPVGGDRHSVGIDRRSSVELRARPAHVGVGLAADPAPRLRGPPAVGPARHGAPGSRTYGFGSWA